LKTRGGGGPAGTHPNPNPNPGEGVPGNPKIGVQKKNLAGGYPHPERPTLKRSLRGSRRTLGTAPPIVAGGGCEEQSLGAAGHGGSHGKGLQDGNPILLDHEVLDALQPVRRARVPSCSRGSASPPPPGPRAPAAPPPPPQSPMRPPPTPAPCGKRLPRTQSQPPEGSWDGVWCSVVPIPRSTKKNPQEN